MADLQIRRASEAQSLFSPLLRALNALVERIAWVVLVLAAAYLVSGVTVVKENEVALVLRFGRLVGDTPSEQVREPGLLVALPFPIDRVVRVPTDLVREVAVDELDASDVQRRDDPYGEEQGDTIDLLTEGYVITGDRFLMQTRMTARYRVSDAILYATGGDADQRERLVHDSVQVAAQRLLSGNASRALFSGLRTLPRSIQEEAQTRLDELDSGIELVEVSMGAVQYPRQVRKAVEDVASAKVQATESIMQARGYQESQIVFVDRELQRVLDAQRSYAKRLAARIEGLIDAYGRVQPQYANAPELVGDRLWREGITGLLRRSGAKTTFIAPPSGERYSGLRVTHSPQRAIDAVSDDPAGGH